MDAKLLTEQGWKSQKTAVKDNGLQQALSSYEKIAATKYDERLKQLAVVVSRATALKAGADAALAKYLHDVLAAAESARHEIASAKAQAQKEQAAASKLEQHAAGDRAADAAHKLEAQKAADELRQKIGKPLLTGLQHAQSGNGKAFQWIATVK